MPVESNSEAFVRLLTEAQSRIYAYILTLIPNEVAAAEVLSDTNVALWRGSPEYQPGTNFGSWATRVAYYQVLAYYKKRNTDRHVFDAELLEEVAEVAHEFAEGYSERRAALTGCVGKLPPAERTLIQQRYQVGMSVAEIASRVGKKANAISQTLFRIRGTLAECVERTLRLESRG